MGLHPRGRRRGPYAGPVARALVDHRAIIDAARVADLFGLDPVAILEDPDPFRWQVRVAAATVVHNDRVAANRADAGT